MKPFQVICAFIGSLGQYGPEESPIRVSVGTEYTVISRFKDVGGWYFELSHDLGVGYPTEFFATLPEQSADEMQQEKHEAIINIETQPA